jgi:spore coat protein U-like protein
MTFGNTQTFKALALGAMAMIGFPARAETQTAVLDVSAIVPAMCKVGDPNLELDLGSVSAGEKERTGNIAVDVTCTAGTPYSITLDTGEQMSLQSGDKANAATPITIKTMIVGPDGASAPSNFARIGTGASDQTTIRITAVLPEKALAGSYSQQSTLTIDW